MTNEALAAIAVPPGSLAAAVLADLMIAESEVARLRDVNARLRAEVARMRPVVEAAVAVAVATEEAGTKLFWSVGGPTRARDALDAALAAYRAGVGS